MSDFEVLFSSYPVGSRTAENRFFAQPMEMNDGNHGAPTPRTARRYTGLAEGHWGVVCLESVAVNPGAVGAPNGLALTEGTEPAFRDLVSTVRAANPSTLLLIQISHSGSKSICVEERSFPPGDDQIRRIQREFVEATSRAVACGFDGIDFKLSHGYFTAELLRPRNQRDDRWGGSRENRLRFALETFSLLREETKSRGVSLGFRISMYEPLTGGMGTSGEHSETEDLTETTMLVEELVTQGADFVNVTAGDPLRTPITIPKRSQKGAFEEHRRYASIVKEKVGEIATIGSAYSVLGPEAVSMGSAEVRSGRVDFVGFGRESLADPSLPRRLERGDIPDWCIACNRCGTLIDRGEAVYCPVFEAKNE